MQLQSFQWKRPELYLQVQWQGLEGRVKFLRMANFTLKRIGIQNLNLVRIGVQVINGLKQLLSKEHGILQKRKTSTLLVCVLHLSLDHHLMRNLQNPFPSRLSESGFLERVQFKVDYASMLEMLHSHMSKQQLEIVRLMRESLSLQKPVYHPRKWLKNSKRCLLKWGSEPQIRFTRILNLVVVQFKLETRKLVAMKEWNRCLI